MCPRVPALILSRVILTHLMLYDSVCICIASTQGLSPTRRGAATLRRLRAVDPKRHRFASGATCGSMLHTIRNSWGCLAPARDIRGFPVFTSAGADWHVRLRKGAASRGHRKALCGAVDCAPCSRMLCISAEPAVRAPDTFLQALRLGRSEVAARRARSVCAGRVGAGACAAGWVLVGGPTRPTRYIPQKESSIAASFPCVQRGQRPGLGEDMRSLALRALTCRRTIVF